MEAIRDASLELCLLSSRPNTSRLARLVCPQVCLDFAEIGPAMHVTGEMARACYTLVFVFACPEKGRSFNFGFEHSDGYMGFFGPGGEVDAVTPQGYANATLTVPVAEFHAALELHFPEIPEKVLKSGAGMRVGPVEEARLRSLLSQLDEALWRSPEVFADPRSRQKVERELLAVFLGALRSGCGSLTQPPPLRTGSRFLRLRQARDYLAAHTHEPIYLEDLCANLGLTSRGVENLFQDLLGISPMTYLRHQRLHGVRRDLLQAEPTSGAVKFAALNWGFLHHGHFARDYRSLFGEKPVETLAR